MNRRELLKNLFAASAGMISLPAWAECWNISEVISHPSTFSITEQNLLASVADTIIPTGENIGAISLGVDKFLQKLFDNCYEPEIQKNVKVQLKNLETAAQNLYGRSFSACLQMEREKMLLMLSGSENKDESEFFKLIKSETIRGFNTSEEVMTEYLNYKVAPGHYLGCVEVKE